MGDFYETDWFGLPTVAKNGPDNTVGSKRTLNVTSGTSTYQLIETLLSASQKPDGSFRQQFEQSNVPVVVPQAQGGGGYSGYWVTYEVDQTILEYESLIAWNVYWCVTGNPFR
ncbi:hypothetical protein MMC27_002049 [Xylographa pallens]|nr:hypothetical protein [Xylographa pallens]